MDVVKMSVMRALAVQSSGMTNGESAYGSVEVPVRDFSCNEAQKCAGGVPVGIPKESDFFPAFDAPFIGAPDSFLFFVSDTIGFETDVYPGKRFGVNPIINKGFSPTGVLRPVSGNVPPNRLAGRKPQKWGRVKR
jgi:hypothetical protein